MKEAVDTRQANKINKQMVHKPKRIGITKEELQSRMPKGTNYKVTDAMIEMIARLEDDIGLDQGMMEEKVLESVHLLKGKNTATLEGYVNAVKFVNLKQFMTNKEAWSIVFREKFNELEANGKTVDNFVGVYNTGYLVTELSKKLIIAPSLQYNHIFHEMVTNLAELARGNSAGGRDVSPMVQMSSASKLLDVLAPPEAQQVDVTIGLDEEVKSMQSSLAEELKRMNDNQMSRLARGEDIIDVQEIGLGSTYAEATEAALNREK